MRHSIRLLAILAVAGLLGACAAPGGGSGVSILSDQDLLQKKEDGKLAAYLEEVETNENILFPTKIRLYKAGKPVPFGTPDTGYTMMWDKFQEVVYVYPGHKTSEFGLIQENTMAYKADKEGRILYQNTPGGLQPVMLLRNVATAEGMGRIMTKGLFQLGSAAASNVGAALINRGSGCSNCGAPVQVLNNATAGAMSKAGVTLGH